MSGEPIPTPFDALLNGPDLAERIDPREVAQALDAEEVGDALQVEAWQFCNRWVYLRHQRPVALRELRALLEKVRHGNGRNDDV